MRNDRHMPLSIAPAAGPSPTPGPHFTIVVPTPAPAPTPIVKNITEAASTWDSIWPLVVAAALGFFTAIAVQLFLVPLADSRKRREQRWEEDVRTLGELLIFEQPKVYSPFWLALYGTAALASVEKPDPHRLEVAKKENSEKLRAASAAFGGIENQIQWLADRVISLAPKSQPAWNLQVLVLRYRAAGALLDGLMPHLRVREDAPTDKEVADGDKRMRKAAKALSDEMIKVANMNAAQFRRRKPLLKAMWKALLRVLTSVKALFNR